MPRPQFSLKTLLWLTAAVATVLTGWSALDLAHCASESGEVPYLTLAWTSAAYIAGLVTLAKARAKL